MNRIWSFLFLLVPLLGMAAFVWAAGGWVPLRGAWLPENLSDGSQPIDGLLQLVHWICAAFFIGIGLALSAFIWKFAAVNRRQALYLNGNLWLELVWTIVPGLILVFIAIHQWQFWSAEKLQRPMIEVDGQSVPQPELVQVVAKQYGWEFHYPGRDQQFDTADDFFVENLLVVPDDDVVVLQLSSRDVIHSFFVPKLRLKQDIVPGMRHIVWFKPAKAATMNILCAELCGWGHYKMNAILKVVSRAEFDEWIQRQQDQYDPRDPGPWLDSTP